MSFASDTVRVAAAGVSAHLLYQVTARLASFAIKAVVVRALKPAQFAFVEIRLYLLVALCLLPTIHGFRPVALRVPSDARALALCVCCAAVSIFLTLLLCGGMLAFDPANTAAVAVVMVSLLVRAFAETPVIFSRRRQRYSQASRARAVATVLSGFSQTVAVSLVRNQRHAAPATAVGHVTYSASLGLLMYHACGEVPLPRVSFSLLRENLLRDDMLMALVATGEGLIKFLLENGEGIVLDIAVSAPAKAAYRLAGNLGSVLARFFSEALEEQSFNVFHRLAPAFRRTGDESDKDMRTTCTDTLLLALKAAITVSVLFALIGPAYSYALLRLLYGERWADHTPAPSLLNLYFVYLVFMAANGVSEAFVSASASTEELKSRTKFSMILSATYVGALYYCARTYEAAGIVYVNCANMAIRTAYSAWFFTRLTGQSVLPLRRALPHPGVVLTLMFARGLSRRSEAFFMGNMGSRVRGLTGMNLLVQVAMHGMSGVLALVLFAGALRIFERGFITKVRGLRKREHEA